MFSQLLVVRLKAAEKALRDGRLDEAFRLATSPDLRDHRRARAVRKGLAAPLLERARQHYRAERFAEAFIDLDRADTCGGPSDRIAELRGQVRTVADEVERQKRTRRERLDVARRRIEGGSLAAGRRILERASQTDESAQELKAHAADRADDAATHAKLARKHMGQGQFAAAAERIRRARKLDANLEAVVTAETELCTKVYKNARAAVTEGRLGRAADELDCLGDLGSALPANQELRDILSLAKKAARSLRQSNFSEARRHLMSLDRLMPKVGWVRDALANVTELEELRVRLFAGPLGETMESTQGTPSPSPDRRPPARASLDDTVALPHRGRAADGLPGQLLLLVDGGGSYLLSREPQVTIGRAAAGSPPDMPIMSDLAERHANVSRVDDDYFLFASKEVEIGGRRTKHHLLRDGDRVTLGRKAKFTFRLPTRKSTTAVLDLSDTTKMPNDVRRVVLFREHASIGQGPTAHVFCRHAGAPLILFERAGTLWIRAKNDGHVDAEARQLKVGEPIEIAGVSLVIEPWRLRSAGRAIS